MSTIAEQYRGPAWWPMRRVASADTGGGRQVFAVWLMLSLAAVVLSILEARHGWSGIVPIGGVGVPVVLYPPLAVTLLVVFWTRMASWRRRTAGRIRSAVAAHPLVRGRGRRSR